jgi:hypothetical protein
LNGTVDITYNNSFLYWNGVNGTGGNSPPLPTIVCGGVTFTLAEYQQKGYDVGSRYGAAPAADALIQMGRDLLAIVGEAADP